MTATRGEVDMSSNDTTVEYLVTTIREIARDLGPTMIEAAKTWPKGSNGPIAILAYEALVLRVDRAIGLLNAACNRVDYRTAGDAIKDGDTDRLADIVNRDIAERARQAAPDA